MSSTALAHRPQTESGTLPCAVCTTPSRREMIHPEADLYRCPDCGHCFSDVDSVRDHETYGAEYHESGHRNWAENPNWQLFRWIEEDISRLPVPVSVLDVGCGRGQFLGYLARQHPGWQLTGIELDTFPAPPGVNLRTGDFIQLDFGQQFDCLVSQAVIEHVADVRAFLLRAVELCKPGGRLIIMTMNEQSVLYGVARQLARLGITAPFDQLYSKHHLNHFTRQSLERLFTECGVSITRRYDHHIPLAAIDFPRQNAVTDLIRKSGAATCFALGTLTGRCYLQTVVGRVPR